MVAYIVSVFVLRHILILHEDTFYAKRRPLGGRFVELAGGQVAGEDGLGYQVGGFGVADDAQGVEFPFG